MKMRPRLLAFGWALLFAGLLCLGQQSRAQLPLTGAGLGKPAGGGGGGCAQATTFLARTSGLSGTETTSYTDLICGLVTDGIITGSLAGATGCGTNLDGLHIWATNTTTTANLNICGTSFGLTAIGSLAFTADQGYSASGGSNALDTGFTPSTSAGKFTQNSALLGGYVLTSRSTPCGCSIAGNSTAGGSEFDYLVSNYTGGNSLTSLSAASSSATAATGNGQGQWISSRTSSTQIDLYKNGNTTPFATNAASPTVAAADQTLLFLARRSGASLVDPTTDTLSAGFYGAGLSAANMALLAGRINAYMTALSINVY